MEALDESFSPKSIRYKPGASTDYETIQQVTRAFD